MKPVVKVTEAKIEEKLVKFCRAHGILTYKFASPSNRGVPDRIFIHGGVVLFLELKRPGNVATELQKLHIQRITQAGGLAFVASSYDEAMAKVVSTFMLKIAEKTKRVAKDTQTRLRATQVVLDHALGPSIASIMDLI